VRLDDPRQNVGGAATAWPFAHAHLARDPGIAIRHVGGRSFIPCQDVADVAAGAIERIIEREAGIAAKPEHVLDAVKAEHAYDRLGAGKLVHALLPRRRHLPWNSGGRRSLNADTASRKSWDRKR